jgi:hypothetical protein
MDEPRNDTQESPAPYDAGYGLRRLLPLAIGAVLGIALAIYLVQRIYGDPTPPLNAEALKQAETTWRAAKIRDYDIEIEVQSRQRETYAVEVRGGTPLQAWRNGQPLKQIRTFDTWSVPGMFDTIHSDFDRTDRQDQPAPELVLRAVFDERTGVPMKYKRIQWGADIEISWRVTRFEVHK